jgi:hypothetical protein
VTDDGRTVGELVALLREARPTSGARPPGLVEGPASVGQEQFWLMDQVDPESRRCLLPEAMRLRGPLDAPALRRAFETLIARHAVLRTAFSLTDDGVLWQTVRAQSPLLYEYRDDRRRSGVGWRDVVSAELASMATRSFDLERAETLRVSVVRLADDEHVLVYVVHHAVFDEASFAVVQRELAELYVAAVGRRPVALQPLPLQYVDFAADQRVRRASSASRLRAYWQERLQGLRPIRIEAHDDGVPDTSSSSSERYLDLDADLFGRVRDVARMHGVSPFMVYLSGYLLVLGRLSGANDIAVATPVSSRRQADLDALVGCFVDTVVVRVAVHEQATFAELLHRVTATCLEAFEHQDIAFSDLLGAAGDVVGSGASSALGHSFVYHSDPTSNRGDGFARLRTERLRIEVAYAKGDFALTVRDGGSDLAVRVQFDRRIFSASTALHAGRAYLDVLRAVVSAPDAPLSTHLRQPSGRPAGPRSAPTAMPPRASSRAPLNGASR